MVGSLVGNLLILTIDLSYLTIKFPEDDVLTIWKYLEGEYPYIVAIARDILGIPSTGVGIKRIFSIARYQERFNRSYSPKVFSNMIIVRLRLSAGGRSVLNEI
jgi:hypothetical protein